MLVLTVLLLLLRLESVALSSKVAVLLTNPTVEAVPCKIMLHVAPAGPLKVPLTVLPFKVGVQDAPVEGVVLTTLNPVIAFGTISLYCALLTGLAVPLASVS